MQGHPIIYAVITLVLAAGILVCLGLIIFHSLKRYSRHFLKNDDPELLNIVLVGTLLIALSQLFGPLVGSTYPIVFGQEASDYRLSFESVYCDISYNNSTDNYTLIATTDKAGMIFDKKKESNISIHDNNVYFINRIDATNLNPFIDYNDQIFLSVVDSSNFYTYLSRPVIKIGQSSDLYILLNRPAGTYQIKLRGEGADGKIRNTMMIIRISIPAMTTFQTGTGIQGYSGSVGTYSGDSTGTTYGYIPTCTGISGYSGGSAVYNGDSGGTSIGGSTSYTPTATYTSTAITPTATYSSTAT